MLRRMFVGASRQVTLFIENVAAGEEAHCLPFTDCEGAKGRAGHPETEKTVRDGFRSLQAGRADAADSS